MPIDLRIRMLIKNASLRLYRLPPSSQLLARAPGPIPPPRRIYSSNLLSLAADLTDTLSTRWPRPRGDWISARPVSPVTTESATATNERRGSPPSVRTQPFRTTSPSSHAAPSPTGTARTASNLPWVWQSPTAIATRSATLPATWAPPRPTSMPTSLLSPAQPRKPSFSSTSTLPLKSPSTRPTPRPSKP
jgi:hypothetical protein